MESDRCNCYYLLDLNSERILLKISFSKFKQPLPGTVIKEGTRIPPDSQTGIINSIAWRGDLMVLGDSTGHLSFWDLKARSVF